MSNIIIIIIENKENGLHFSNKKNCIIWCKIVKSKILDRKSDTTCNNVCYGLLKGFLLTLKSVCFLFTQFIIYLLKELRLNKEEPFTNQKAQGLTLK